MTDDTEKDMAVWRPHQHQARASELLARAEESHESWEYAAHLVALANTHIRLAELKLNTRLHP